MRHAVFAAAVLALSTSCVRHVIVEGVGPIEWSQLCKGKDCGVAGGQFQPLDLGLDGRSVLNIGSVGEVLGAVIDPNNVKGLPSQCAGPKLSEADWQSRVLARTDVATQERTAGRMKTVISAALANELNRRQVQVTSELRAAIEAVSDRVSNEALKMQNTYYYLKEDARARRRAQCGPDTSSRRLVISAAMIEMSGQSETTTREALATALQADAKLRAAIPAVGDGGAGVGIGVISEAVSQVVVATVVDRQLFPIVVGYDAPVAGKLPTPSDRARLACLLEAAANSRLDCKVFNSDVVNGAPYAIAIARIPADQVAAGYFRTGGGCRMTDYSEQPGNHNAILAQAAPEGADGWRCKIADPPGIPVARPIQAYVLACQEPVAECRGSTDDARTGD